MKQTATNNVVVFGPDGMQLAEAIERTKLLTPHIKGVKIHDLYDRHGPGVVRNLIDVGVKFVVVDAKLHDTPKTVGLRVAAIAESGAHMITIHVQGGHEMMRAAIKNAGEASICGITVLSSLAEEDVHLTFGQPAKAASLYFARMAKQAGLMRLVCAPQEVGFLSRQPDLKDMGFMVPGTRFPGTALGDQKRSTTPLEALKNGADLLVMVTDLIAPSDPAKVLADFQAEIDRAAQGSEQ